MSSLIVTDRDGEATPTYQAALQYVRLGFPVLSIWRSDEYGICGCYRHAECGAPGKHPRVRRGIHGATTDEQHLSKWNWETANVGIVMGKESGAIALDIDPRNGGDKTMVALLSELGPLPECPWATTGGGGKHLLFGAPDCPVPSRSNVFRGVDVKGDGGFIIAEPSRHASGQLYRWGERLYRPLPDLPEPWLKAILPALASGGQGVREYESRESKRERIVVAPPLPQEDIQAATARAIEETVPTGPGQWNAGVFEYVRRLKGMPWLADANPCALLETHLRPWWEKARPHIQEQEFMATCEHFLAAWGTVRYPVGANPLEAIYQMVQHWPAPPELCTCPIPQCRILANICRKLSEDHGGGKWFLSWNAVGQLFKVDDRQAGRWLTILCAAKVIKMVEKPDKANKIAARYVYIGRTV